MAKKLIKKKAKTKLSAVERRRSLIEAAVPLFAKEGFRGVTTKELAAQAGVSEALLYQHFPSKDDLYSEVQDYCCQPREELSSFLTSLAPSTETLVSLLHFQTKMVIEKIVLGHVGDDLVFPRLMTHSLLEDGEFARLYLQRSVTRMAATMHRSVIVARASGDLKDDQMPDELRFWFCHHLLVTVLMYRLPAVPVSPYSVTDDQMVDHLMIHMLRGIGLTDAAIARCANAEKLRKQSQEWLNLAKSGQDSSEGDS